MRLTHLVWLGLLLATAPRAEAQTAYVVVVNETNPVKRITRADLSRIFLKRATSWPEGGPVAPVDLSEASPSREAFSRDVHRKSVAAVRAFWQQQIFSGRDTPPPVKRSEEEVLDAVRGDPTAVAYVSADRAMGTGVRPLLLSD